MTLNYIIGLIIIGGILAISKVEKDRLKGTEVKTTAPDSPIGFGYKNNWLAIKTNNNLKVAEALQLNVKPINWKDGVDAGYSGKIFITPPIDGWVLVLGICLDDFEDDENLKTLESLSLEFGECQSFLTNRIVEYHSWAIIKKGELIRAVRYFIEDERPYVILGNPTEIEEKIKFVPPTLDEINSESYWEKDDIFFPNEETVMIIAENWSINPTLLEKRTDLEGLGLVNE